MRWQRAGEVAVVVAACTALAPCTSRPRDPASALNRSTVLRIVEHDREVLDAWEPVDCRGSSRLVVAVDGPGDVDLDVLERAGNDDGWSTWWRGEVGPNDHVIHGAPQLAFEGTFGGEAAHVWVTIGENPEFDDAWTLVLSGSC